MKYALEGTKSPDLEQIPLKPEENNINNNENNIDIKNNQKQNYQFIVNNPRRDEEKYIDIRADYIWEGFPLSERFWYSFCCKTKCCSDYKNGDVFTTQCFREKCNNASFCTYINC